MNREIKFRAWDKKENKLYYPNNCQNRKDYNTYYCGDLEVSLYTIEELSKDDDFVLMQFTGLQDKNGVDIYEGDIICDDKYNTWEWRGIVKFSHGVFGAEWLTNIESQSMVGSWGQKHNLRTFDDDILERKVIIGNVFENPELLK